ncbi:type IV pilus assembly protein PilM [bacterium]|nr:type IV pilus assembly protein PilM [bacterium]
MDFLNSIFQKTLVGLDIGVSGIKAVELGFGKKTSLISYNRISLPWDSVTPEGTIKDDAAVVSALKKLFSAKSFSTRDVSVGLFGNSVLTKPISMPTMSRKDMEEQIYWEAEQYIPFNVEECSIDFAVVGNTVQKVVAGAESSVEVLLVAVKNDYIQSFTSVIERAGLRPTIIDYQAFALGNSFEFNYSRELAELNPGETDLIVDFGAGSTKLSFVSKENTVFTTKVPACGSGYSQLISERLGESFEQGEVLKLAEPESPLVSPIIQDYNAYLASEIQKNTDVYFSQSGDRSLRKIFYCGGASKTPGLISLLSERYPEQVENLDPLKNLFVNRTKSNQRMLDDFSCLGTVALGLALRKSGDGK